MRFLQKYRLASELFQHSQNTLEIYVTLKTVKNFLLWTCREMPNFYKTYEQKIKIKKTFPTKIHFAGRSV